MRDCQQFASIIFLLVFLMLVLFTQKLFVSYQLSPEISRKFLHVTGGLLALVFPLFIKSHWYVLVLCSLAMLLLLVTFIRKWLPSIHQTKRPSIGSIIFPVAIYCCFVIAEKHGNLLLYFLPVVLLTIADTVAELGGNKWGHYSSALFNNKKTVIGSFCFAATAFCLSIVLIVFVYHAQFLSSIPLLLSITIATTVAELLSFKGLDNLTVPLIAVIVLLLFT